MGWKISPRKPGCEATRTGPLMGFGQLPMQSGESLDLGENKVNIPKPATPGSLGRIICLQQVRNGLQDSNLPSLKRSINSSCLKFQVSIVMGCHRVTTPS
jgi:hypothetical protein